MLLSIIIPVYNVQDYISNCLESALNQNLEKTDYEILAIDDGSEDKSYDILAQFEKENSNITVYKQINKGVGAARKTGLRNAKGKYIYFLDGDDYLASNTLKQLITILEDYHLDILGFKTRVTNQLNLQLPDKIPNEAYVPSIQSGIDFLGTNPNYRVELWWYVLNKSFFEHSGLTFEDDKFVNDSYFTPGLFLKASRVAFFPMEVHRYVKRPNSITSKTDQQHYIKHIKDLEYAIFKMKDIISALPNEAIGAHLTLKIKQESYVLFSFIRFMKSDLKWSYFLALLGRYKKISAYPLNNLNKGSNYQSVIFRILIPIFNQPILLFPVTIGAKLFFRIRRVIS